MLPKSDLFGVDGEDGLNLADIGFQQEGLKKLIKSKTGKLSG